MTEKRYYLGIQELEQLDPDFGQKMSKGDKEMLAKIKANFNIDEESETVQTLDFVLIKKLHTDFPESEVLQKIYDRLVKENNVGSYDGFNTILDDDLDDSEKQINFTLNYTKDEIRNILSGISEVTNGTAIQAAASYLRGSKSASAMAGFSKPIKKERERLEEYISNNNLWYNGDPGSFFDKGVEQKVYLLGDAKSVIKYNPSGYYRSWLRYFNSLLLHNYFFKKTAYELVGFTRRDGELNAVVKQPYIKATEITDLAEVKKFMEENGFTKIPTRKDDYRNDALGLVIEDLHDKNVLTKDGILYFIDTIFYTPKLQLESGGNLDELNSLEATISKDRQDYQTKAALTIIQWLKADNNPNDEQNTGIIIDTVKKAIREMQPSIKEYKALIERMLEMKENIIASVEIFNAYQRVIELYEAWLVKKDEMAKSAHKKLTGLESKAIHKYQWMRNKEGGQVFGNQQIIVPEDEEIFERDSKPLLRKEFQKWNFEQYKKEFGQLYMSYVKRDGQGEWELSKSDSLEKLIPPQSRFDKGWVKEIADFNSPEAIKQGKMADSDAEQQEINTKPVFPYGKALLDMTVAEISDIQAEVTGYYFDELIEPVKKEVTELQNQFKALPTRSPEKTRLKSKIEALQDKVLAYDADREHYFLESWEALQEYLIEYTLDSGLIDAQKISEDERDSLFAEMFGRLASYTFEREREATWDQKLIDVWLDIVRDHLFEGELKLGKGYKVPTVRVAGVDLPEPVAPFVEFMLHNGTGCKLISAGYDTNPVEDILPCWAVHLECIAPPTQLDILTAFENNIKVLVRGNVAPDIYFLLPYKIGPGDASAARNYFTQLEFDYARNKFYNKPENGSYEDKLKWFKKDLEDLQQAFPEKRYAREKLLYIDLGTSYTDEQLIVFFDSQPEGALFNVLLHGKIVSAYQNYIPATMVKKDGFYDLIRNDNKLMVAEGRASFQIVDMIFDHQVTVMTEKSPYPKITIEEKKAIQSLPQESLPAPKVSVEFEAFSPQYGATTCVISDLAYVLEHKFCSCADGTDYHFNEYELDQLKDILATGETQTFVPSAKLTYPLNWIAKMKPAGNLLHLPQERMSTAEYADVKRIMLKSDGVYKKNAFEFEEPALDVYLRILGGEEYNLKKKFQYFATPAATADYMVKLADIRCGMSFLEPSAGRGAIISAIRRVCPNAAIDYCEAMPLNLKYLKSESLGDFICEDFLKIKEHSDKKYDRIIANPPFSKNQDESHIELMYELLAPQGRMVTVASTHWQFAADKQSTAFREWIDKIKAQVIDVPAGTFKESGTAIPTVIIVAEKK